MQTAKLVITLYIKQRTLISQLGACSTGDLTLCMKAHNTSWVELISGSNIQPRPDAAKGPQRQGPAADHMHFWLLMQPRSLGWLFTCDVMDGGGGGGGTSSNVGGALGTRCLVCCADWEPGPPGPCCAVVVANLLYFLSKPDSPLIAKSKEACHCWAMFGICLERQRWAVTCKLVEGSFHAAF